MKRGKEITLDIETNYKIKLGTVDNKNTKSIYINLSAWGELIPTIDIANLFFLSYIFLYPFFVESEPPLLG